TLIKWSGSNRVLARTGRASIESTDPEVVNLEQTLTGEYEPATQSLRFASNVGISRAGTSLGTVELTAAMKGVKRSAVTDVSLTMGGVMGDTLNLWLRETTAIHVDAGQFDATVKAHVEGTRTSFQGNVTGSGVRLRSADRAASPPVDISLQHVGSFDSVKKEVAIETLTLTIGDRVKTLLSGALDRPVSLHLERPEGKTSSAEGGAEPSVWSLRLTPLEIQDLRPWLSLLGRDPLKEVSAGKLGGALIVSMYEHGAIVDVAGRLEATDVMLRAEGSGRADLMGPLGVVTDLKSRLTGLQLLKLDPLTTSVSLNGKQIAALHATGAWRFADVSGLTALDGTVTLAGLPGETLNPLLGLWTSTRIGRAQIDGHADVVVDEGQVRWVVDVRGEEIQLRLQEATTDALPLNLLIKQAGEFDRVEQKLRLDRLSFQVVERRRPIVSLALDKPLSLSFAQGKKGDRSQTGESPDPITLALRINRLGVNQLRLWVALAGNESLASVRSGVLDADLQVHISGADDASVAGRLDLEEVTFERGARHASAPVTLGTEVRASILGRSRVIVDSWAVRALAGKTVLGEARLTGSADAGGATDLVLNLAVSDLSEFVGRFGLLTERQQELVSGGDLKGDVRLITAGPMKPLTIKAGLRSANLIMRLDKTHQLTRSLGLQAEVEVDAAWTVVDLQRLEVAVESGGTKAGTLTANGRWPLSVAGTSMPAGAVSVTVKEWDSGPFVDFFGLLPGRRPGPLPLTGELNVTQETGGKTLAVRGQETIGPITVAVNGGAPESATVHVEQDVAQSGDEIRVRALSLATEGEKGRADQVAMSGNIRMGSQPSLELRGSVEAFNADWYAALTAPSSEQTPTDKPPTAKGVGGGIAVPLDLDVDLTIGSVTWLALEIGKGRLIAKGDGHTMQMTLEPTGLASGSVQGTITVVLKGGQPEFGWDAKGDALDLGVLTKAASAEAEPRVTGRGKFTTSGTGRGQGEALRQSLSGTVIFDVAEGQFVKSPFLEFLAEQTHIEEFRALGFRTVHGELQIKDGWVHLNQVRVVGPAVAVEADGKIGLDGRLDMEVQPKIGPALSGHVNIPCLNQILKTVDGFTVLPVAVTVQGTTEKPIYGAQVTAGKMVGRHAGALVGTIADLFTGCQGGAAAQKATEEAVGVIKDKAKDLIKDLFDGKKKP
ncbi:MAG: AsmA-like C-terminal region-containing protein, partial [Nitrospirota bacterium]